MHTWQTNACQSLSCVFICGWATGDMRLSLTCDRNTHRSPHPWLSHPRGIIQTYDVTLSLVISRELSHIWRLLPGVRGKSHGSNWEGFDRAVAVASESRANGSFEPIQSRRFAAFIHQTLGGTKLFPILRTIHISIIHKIIAPMLLKPQRNPQSLLSMFWLVVANETPVCTSSRSIFQEGHCC